MNNSKIEISSDLLVELNKETPVVTKKKIAAKMKIAAMIDDVRQENNWNKRDLAKKLNRHQSEITKWLSGTHNFTIDTITEIEEILKIKILSLTGEATVLESQYQYEIVGPNLSNEPQEFFCKNPSSKIMKFKYTKSIRHFEIKQK